MKKKPRILITNDDGIYAMGIRHLWHALKDVADLSIVAPVSEKSGSGLGITIQDPLHIHTVEWENQTPAWKVSGTPADCIRLALSVILDHVPDLIVSGINRGANSGRNVLYSGTVGGVIEGVLRNVPGVAFSCSDFDKPDYVMAEKFIAPLVHYVLDHPLTPGTLLNVNIPTVASVKGVKLASQGRGYWIESPDQRMHPEGRPYYWLGGKWNDVEEDSESDVALLKEGYVTAVPIHVHELTDHALLKSRKTAFDKHFT